MANTQTASRVAVIADKVAAQIAPTKAYAFKGKMATLRTTALAGIASLAYTEGKSRADTIAQLRIALGAKPSDADVNACKLEYVTGRIAQRLAGSDLPKADMTVADRIAFARALVTQYASPAKDGVKSSLRAGQLGRRSVSQHKLVRASDEAWSQVKAEVGIGAAKTQDAKNAAKKTRTAQAAKAATAGAAPSHAELVKPAAALTKEDAMNHLLSQAATLLAYVNKNAKLVTTDAGTAIRVMHKAIAKEAALVAAL